MAEMNRQRPHGKPSRSLASSHQRSWLWGRHAVMETLTAARWPIIELLIDEDFPDEDVRELHALNSSGLRVQRVSAHRITELCKAEDHQGWLARMGEFPCGTLDDLGRALDNLESTMPPDHIRLTDQRTVQPLFLVCDRIQDSHNFGAILRCCDAMRVNGVIVGDRSQVSVTPHVARASAGAVNHLTIYRVSSLSDSLRVMKSRNIRILAASEKSGTLVWQQNTRCSLAIIIGSEAFGVAPELFSECDAAVAIPMLGGVSSLNAAVAAGMLLYECRRQQIGAP